MPPTFSERLNTLTEREAEMLLFVLGVMHPPGFNLEVTLNLIKCYKKDVLQKILAASKAYVKEEFSSIHDSLTNKLFGEIKLN